MSRGQSTVIGTILLVAVMVVSVTVFGFFSFASVTDSGGTPVVDVDGTLTTAGLTLAHGGGDALPTDTLTVIIRNTSHESTLPFEDGVLGDDGDGRFEPGDRWSNATSLPDGERLTVYLVHDPSNTVLYKGRRSRQPVGTVPTPTATPTGGTPTLTPAGTPTATTTPTNIPPVADNSVSCSELTCTFDASGSSDGDGTIVSYDWDFGDGATASGSTVTHAYGMEGTYTTTLTVTDDDGATDTVSVPVSVAYFDPTLAGVAVEDNSANSNGAYRVSYDVVNTAEFDQVEVTFDDLNETWADSTATNASSRGYVEYAAGGVEGDTFEITIRVFNDTGAVTDSQTITDVADGGDAGGSGDLTYPDSPEFNGTVVDDVSAFQADYEVSYNVTNRTNFSHVRVEVENLDSGGADGRYTSTAPRTNVDDYAVEAHGGTFGDDYRITMQVLDDSGIVVDEVVVTDTADGTDPAGNSNLSRPESPTLQGSTVRDKSHSNKGARYDVQYDATVNAEFAHVEVQFRNVDSPSASETQTGTGSDRLTHQPGYGYGDQYVISIRVVDIDGIVVDEVVVSDGADGTDP